MEKNIYRLANRIQMTGKEHCHSVKTQVTDENMPEDQYNGKLDDFSRMKYEQSVLCEIRKDQRARRRKQMRTAAACLALLAAVTAVFHEEVRAAIGDRKSVV